MAWKVLLQPCGDSDANKHFVDTIENPVEVNRIRSFLTPGQIDQIAPILEGRQAIPVWGVTPGKNEVNSKKWRRIEVGDTALFSRDGRIFASSTVAEKFQNHELAEELWKRNAEGETWEYIYFLDELTRLDIPYATFNAAAGYKPNNVIQGFNVLSEERSALLDNAFDLRSDRFPETPSEDSFRDDVRARFDQAFSLNISRETQSRLEQGFLRGSLFGRRMRATCCVCGHEFPVDLMVAAHIKKRSFCSLEEQLDFEHVVAPMCLAGCDALFERGYVVVSGDGTIERGRENLGGSGLIPLLERVAGRACSHWSSQREPYFAWHRRHHGTD